VKARVFSAVVIAVSLVAPRAAHAQILPVPGARIVYGHHHLHVTDVAAHKKFWVDGLGATIGPKKLGPFDVVRISKTVILLQPMAPKAGGTKGSSVGHLGVEVPDMRAALARLRAAGFPIVTRAELPPAMPVKDDILEAGGLTVAFVMGPDDTLVELVENKTNPGVGNHHLHFATTAPDETKAWYARAFGAKAAKLVTLDVQEIPGVILMYTPAKQAPGTTKDRVLDHIGFEVKNLEAFCKELEASGVKLDTAYRQILGLGVAFLTDPWGTVIELTEGLDQY